jgi:hypothetical protein
MSVLALERLHKPCGKPPFEHCGVWSLDSFVEAFCTLTMISMSCGAVQGVLHLAFQKGKASETGFTFACDHVNQCSTLIKMTL